MTLRGRVMTSHARVSSLPVFTHASAREHVEPPKVREDIAWQVVCLCKHACKRIHSTVRIEKMP
jgi:hypothetical protein